MTARSSRLPGRAKACKQCVKSNLFGKFPRKLSRSRGRQHARNVKITTESPLLEKKKKKSTPKKQLAFESDPKYRCRYYEAEYPELEQVVVVQVNAIKSMGAYVSLLEYDGVEGMVLLSELSRRRIRSINKFLRQRHQY